MELVFTKTGRPFDCKNEKAARVLLERGLARLPEAASELQTREMKAADPKRAERSKRVYQRRDMTSGA